MLKGQYHARTHFESVIVVSLSYIGLNADEKPSVTRSELPTCLRA